MQAFFSPYSTYKLKVRKNNANTAYCVVLLDPRGHMESLVLFFFKLYLSKDPRCQNKDKRLYLCHHVRSTRASKKRSEDKDRMCLELAEVGIATIWLFVWSSVCYFWPGCFQRSNFCLITSFWYLNSISLSKSNIFRFVFCSFLVWCCRYSPLLVLPLRNPCSHRHLTHSQSFYFSTSGLQEVTIHI